MDVRIRALTNLGIPVDNVKIHPDCQSFVSPSVLVKRRVEWGFKILGAFVGTDEYVLLLLLVLVLASNKAAMGLPKICVEK